MSKHLRVGLIGAGMVSRHHLIAWASLAEDARVIAIADPSTENAMQRASEFGIDATFSTADQMLSESELDAVDSATRLSCRACATCRQTKPGNTLPEAVGADPFASRRTCRGGKRKNAAHGP